jgi:hypothetical protein
MRIMKVIAVVATWLVASAANAQEDRQLTGQELLKLLPGKTASGYNRSGEWIWKLEAGGKGWQVWDSGAHHAMTWEIDGDRLCYVFSVGKRSGERRCREVHVLGGGGYALKSRKGKLSKFRLR